MCIEPLLRAVLGSSWVQPGWTEAGAPVRPHPSTPISPEAEFPEDSVHTALWSLSEATHSAARSGQEGHGSTGDVESKCPAHLATTTKPWQIAAAWDPLPGIANAADFPEKLNIRVFTRNLLFL